MNPFAEENARLRAQVDSLMSRVLSLEGLLASKDKDCPLDWRLTHNEGCIVGELIRAKGNPVPVPALETAVWPSRKPHNSHHIVYILIHRVRHKLSKWRVRIDTHRGRGYALRFMQEKAA